MQEQINKTELEPDQVKQLIKTLEVAKQELVNNDYAEGTGAVLMIQNQINTLRS